MLPAAAVRGSFAEIGILANMQGAAEQRVPCPQCSKQRRRDAALGVNISTGAFHCFRCGWKGRVGGEISAPRHPIARLDDPAIAERKRERLRTTWRETTPLQHANARAVRRYLEARALGEVLSEPPAVLRAHSSLEYWDGTESLGKFPAMVALFQSATGEPVTLHVTYLRQDGDAKAAVPNPKKILGVPKRGATSGGAIHLHAPHRGVLGIAEGIESALSLHVLQRVPVWASFCADNLERVRLPHDLSELHIGVDVDDNGKGESVARNLSARARRWSPRTRVTLWWPDLEGPGDLNDELRRRAG